VDPILINSLILRGISTRFLTENQVINKDDIQVDLDNILEEARDMLLDDPYSVLSNNMNNDLYDKLMSFSNDDLVEVCKEAFELLKKDNSHVYDTTPMNMYSEELIPYFQKIMDDEEMMEV
jgi:flagellar biosynthesis regulator FlbT